MAADTSSIGAGQVVVAIHMALRALHAAVRAGEREAGGRMIEGGRRPGGRRVALLASLREARGNVIRIRRALEILQVAADTSRIGAGQVVVAIHMALRALHAAVCAAQREARGRVIEGGARPGSRSVALLASLREA